MGTAELLCPDPSSLVFLIKDLLQLLATVTTQGHTLVVLSKCDIQRFARIGGTMGVIWCALPVLSVLMSVVLVISKHLTSSKVTAARFHEPTHTVLSVFGFGMVSGPEFSIGFIKPVCYVGKNICYTAFVSTVPCDRSAVFLPCCSSNCKYLGWVSYTSQSRKSIIG